MESTPEVQKFRARLQRLDGLIQEVERSTDAASRARTQEIVRTVLELHEKGLERILQAVAGAGEAGRAVLDALAQDEQVACTLLLHGLHPRGFEERVLEALEKVRPYLRSHGGNVELLSITDGAVRVRMVGSCHSCPSSSATLRQLIAQAIYDAAPDVLAVEVERVSEPPAPAGLVQLGRLPRADHTSLSVG
jgi:Fe-S cluster biogenesis protein NfuA